MSRVLIVSERWWPDGTGGVLASHLIARLLRDAGFRLTVVHGTREPLRLNGVRYVYSSLLSVRDKHRLWLNCSLLAKEHWFRKLIDGSDVVYVPRYCYPLIPVAKRLGKRVIVHLHDHQPVSYNSIVFSEHVRSRVNTVSFEVLEHGSVARALFAGFTSPMNRLCRVWLKDADAVICVSRRQAELISKLAPELAEKLKVVYNPLPNTPLVEKNLGNSTFLYLGGDSYVKGFSIFLRASQEVLKRNLNVKFLLAGGFKDVNRLIIEKLNRSFKRAYNLLGYLKHEEVSKLYSISHALLFPSICEEPLPYAVLEAMLMGTIPIASKVGGIPEIVGGTYAEEMMFEPGNVEELVSRMESVLTMSSEQIVDVGHRLREAVLKKFNPEVVKRELIKVFNTE
ncbi:MAG: glycosyltransferase family 4 protein [Crenarchaeota archaeon]|nr:glycosyltransferase family 4 protein [Thermoproteota archaeon]